MLASCQHCGQSFHQLSEGAGEFCPHCGQQQVTVPYVPQHFGETVGTWWFLVRHPFQYFSHRRNPRQSLSHTLSWAIVCSWIGFAVMLLWQFPLEKLWEGHIDREERLILVWAVVLVPFWIPLSVFFRAIWITAGLWIVGLVGRTHFDKSMNIAGHSEVSNVLNMVPVVGPVAAEVSRFLVTIAGVSREYSIGWMRASLALVAPLAAIALFLAFALVCIAVIVGSVVGLAVLLTKSNPIPF